MLLLLHGAKKNVGDFLIFERAKALISRFLPQEELIERPRWESPTTLIEVVKQARAVVICGGPGWAQDFAVKTYPFLSHLERFATPVVPLGLGWSGRPAGHPEAFAFGAKSQAAFSEIHARRPVSSVRDAVTHSIVTRLGAPETLMTGCPVWYQLDHLERDFVAPAEIRRLVVTSPALPSNFPACGALLALIAERFPRAERVIAFHRGLRGRLTSVREMVLSQALAVRAASLGYDVVDVSGDTQRIAFYGACDLHVGYRVHAHICFLSLRRPSVLIEEDGRGTGQTATLGSVGIDARKRGSLEAVMAAIEAGLDNGFPECARAVATMRARFPVMRSFVESI